MSHHAYFLIVHGDGQHASLTHSLQSVRRRPPRFAHIEDHDIRLYPCRIKRDTGNRCKLLREELRILMVHLKALWSTFQSDKPCSGQHAGLAHTASEHFPDTAASFYEFSRAD